MQSNSRANKPQIRKPREITPEYLQKAALYYLQRYASSREGLRQVLLRRLKRARLDKDRQYLDMVDAAVENIQKKGLLDDQNFAWHRIKSMNSAGKSLRKIKASLQQKGVGEEDAETALQKLLEDDPDMEFQAALKFAKRKKIGPFRTGQDSDPRRELQQLAAAGFSYEMAKKILESDSEE